jgi:hypothetical protein
MTKDDIEETLKHVCKKVLFDKSASISTRERRATALLILGEQYVRKMVQDVNGIEDFLEKFGARSGLFGDASTEFNPFAAFDTPPGDKAGAGAGAGAGTAEGEAPGGAPAPPAGASASSMGVVELLELVSKVESMGVRQLKETIHALGGDSTGCIEKEDLQKKLSEVLTTRLNEADR